MFLKIIFAAFLFWSSCFGKTSILLRNEFTLYVTAFKRAALNYAEVLIPGGGEGFYVPGSVIDRLVIEFEDMLGKKEWAFCECDGQGAPHIFISQAHWNNLTELGRENLIFHELGHCILNRDHVDRLVEENGEMYPVSVMFPTTLSDELYEKHRDYYLRELFLGAVNPGKSALKCTRPMGLNN